MHLEFASKTRGSIRAGQPQICGMHLSPQVCEDRLDPVEVLSCVHAYRILRNRDNVDAVSMLQDPQLLERFRDLERRGRQTHETQQEFPPVEVYADMLVVSQFGFLI